MAKNEMKNVGVVVLIMIMLCFSEAKLSCSAVCGISCLESFLSYPLCFGICIAKCSKMSKEASECITHCGVNKSITSTLVFRLLQHCFHIFHISVNMFFHISNDSFCMLDGSGVVSEVMDSYLQKC
ncbi:hypothetical protein V8G54_024123 [Vigna mungo]|uniref:Uncharacterized protein n=1 Tax=Vigna mungo TaxID=3915 RepID=A0AAQ3RR08_VIGMU